MGRITVSLVSLFLFYPPLHVLIAAGVRFPDLGDGRFSHHQHHAALTGGLLGSSLRESEGPLGAWQWLSCSHRYSISGAHANPRRPSLSLGCPVESMALSAEKVLLTCCGYPDTLVPFHFWTWISRNDASPTTWCPGKPLDHT